MLYPLSYGRKSRVAKVMEPKPFDVRSATRGIKGGLHGRNRFPVHQKDMRLVQVADLIQFFQLGGQDTRKGDTSCVMGFGIFCFEPNQPRLQVDTIPRQVQNFTPSHDETVSNTDQPSPDMPCHKETMRRGTLMFLSALLFSLDTVPETSQVPIPSPAPSPGPTDPLPPKPSPSPSPGPAVPR